MSEHEQIAELMAEIKLRMGQPQTVGEVSVLHAESLLEAGYVGAARWMLQLAKWLGPDEPRRDRAV